MKTTPDNGLSRFRGDEGQSMVEFAVILPIIVMLFLAIWQLGVGFHNYLAITDAARVGARAAAVNRASTTGPCQAAKNAIQATVSTAQWSVISSRITCTPSTPGAVGSAYTVSIAYPITITVFFSRTGTLTASATERLE
jgi:Flp pilus assembly protein TadG